MICDGFNCLPLLVLWLLPIIITIVGAILFMWLGVIFGQRYKANPSVRRYQYMMLTCFILAAAVLSITPARFFINKIKYQNASRHKASSLGFTFYEPASISSRLTSRIVEDPKNNGNSFIVSQYENVSVQEFNVAKTAQAFNVSQSKCGPYDPDFGYVLRSCKLLGTASNGVNVYYNAYPPRSKPMSSSDFAFATLSGTGVTVKGNFSSWQDVLDIYGSLKQVDPSTLHYPSSKGVLDR